MLGCPTARDVSTAVREIFGVLPQILCPNEADDRMPAKVTSREVPALPSGEAASQGAVRRGGRVKSVEIDRSCVSGEARIDGRSLESCSNFVSIRTLASTSVIQVAPYEQL